MQIYKVVIKPCEYLHIRNLQLSHENNGFWRHVLREESMVRPRNWRKLVTLRLEEIYVEGVVVFFPCAEESTGFPAVELRWENSSE